MRQAIAAVLLASSLGCASSVQSSRALTPVELSRLEAEVAASPHDVTAGTRLARAYVAAKRHAEARPLLEKVVAAQPDHADASVLLGVTYEELGQFADARRVYRSYIENGSSRKLRNELTQRLPLLQRKELEASVRTTLAREAEIANTVPQPFTVAVFPYQFVGDDPQYAPLGRALADMLVFDLTQTGRLRVLERAHVQLLLDEMKLAENGIVDPATASRTGRMLGAERVVQGSLDGGVNTLNMETTIVRVREGMWPGETPSPADRPNLLSLSESAALNQLFDMQNRTSIRIFSSLGIPLSEAERVAINRRPTESLMAVLAYGRGLQAEDAGDFRTAAQHFSEAARLDPGFAQARTSSQRVTATAQAAAVSTTELAAQAEPAAPPPASTEFFLPNPMSRDQVAEILRTEGTSPTFLEIILRRPR